MSGANITTDVVTTSPAAPSAPISASGTITRELGAILSDSYNLQGLGALLDGSSGDQTTIQSIYDDLPNGAVVFIPATSNWGGSIPTPSPTKMLTWNLMGGFPNIYGEFIGDGDLSLGYRNGSAQSYKILENTTEFSAPIYALLWNCDPNYTGPYSGNYNQMATVSANYLTGATSSGNTSGISIQGDSYGMNPTGSYEVGLDININKYGQNSIWGIVYEQNDFSGLPPQAFASWLVELDTVANGHDMSPMDPSYYTPQAGNRTTIYTNLRTLPWDGWSASTAYVAKSTAQGGATSNQVAASVIAVTATDGNPYCWVCSQSGTSSATAPLFPPPAIFTAGAASGVLTVTAVQSGSPEITVGMVLTGNRFLVPVTVVSQANGTPGGVGTYEISYSETINACGMYGAIPIADGSTKWTFGTEYGVSVSSVFWVEQDSSTVAPKVGTVFGAGCTIYNAAFDCSQATMLEGAAALRMAPNHVIDFSYEGNEASRNARFMGYSTYDGGDVLFYQVNGSNLFEISDSGNVSCYGATQLAAGSLGNISGLATGWNASGLIVGYGYLGNGETDLCIDANGASFIINDNGTLTSSVFDITPAGVTSYGFLRTGGLEGPTWTSGTGTPTTTEPNGSLYSRSDGTTGARLYLSTGSGWSPITGV
jgi:hypothetical protein